MPIRPEILAQIMDTRCFLETFRLTCCIQNIAEHILCPNLTLGRIQNVPEMSKSTIFGNFHHSEKLNLRNSAHFNSAQIRLKTLEIYSPIHFGHLIPYGDFNFLNRFGPKYSLLKIATFYENPKIANFKPFRLYFSRWSYFVISAHSNTVKNSTFCAFRSNSIISQRPKKVFNHHKHNMKLGPNLYALETVILL